MRAAVISDIHSNLPALEAVLDSVEEVDLDELWCLGDVVGYGAQPDACTELIRERCEVCLAGNHDLAVLGEIDTSAFSETAAQAVTWTRANCDAGTLDFLRELEPAGERLGVGIFHASPRDPVWEYVLSVEQAEACIAAQSERIALIGHSHVALFFSAPQRAGSGEVRGAQMGDGASLQVGSESWLLNPGSVGQPRDGDPRAAWLELDLDQQTARFHRVPYDIDRAAESISAAGLPEHLGQRLYLGQ